MADFIKLTAKGDRYKTKFYFRTMEECDEFKHVFADHWCNVEWNPPDTVSGFGLSVNDLMELDKPAKERAELALAWGFNGYMPEHGGRNTITDAQQRFVDQLMKQTIEEDPEPTEAVSYEQFKANN